ncbi:ribosomal RNA large subunit methyltransferaseK/L, partial [Striga asiatica]
DVVAVSGSTRQIEMYGRSSMPSTSSAKDVYRQRNLEKMKRKYADFDSAKKDYIDKVRRRNKLRNPQDKWFLRAQITMNESEGTEQYLIYFAKFPEFSISGIYPTTHVTDHYAGPNTCLAHDIISKKQQDM